MQVSNETLNKLLAPYAVPKMVEVAQQFDSSHIHDVEAAVRQELAREEIAALMRTIQRDETVAITCGSRGIAHIALVLKTIVDAVKSRGAQPFIFPAMGSHGGATAAGQKELLALYGVTEASVGAPIKATMETVVVGKTKTGKSVNIDAFAASAHHVIVVNRVKAHTAFTGTYESGLMKMMVVGMGKHVGAIACHDEGFGMMAKNIPEFAEVVMKKVPILFGVALVENAYEQTCLLKAIPAKSIPSVEPELLLYAKSRMGRLLFSSCDILINDYVGKNISGEGVDPNVTGRVPTPYCAPAFTAQRMAILDITDESHGNCYGIGFADVITQRLLDKSDLSSMYINAVTSTVIPGVKIPMICENHKRAIQCCIATCVGINRHAPKLIRIKDTLHVGTILISEAMLDEAKKNPALHILGEPKAMHFDEHGNLF